MTKQEITKIVSDIMHVPERRVSVGRDTTTVECSMDVNYDTLARLAEALGVTDINFVYTEGEPGYSSWTPGTDGSFSFTIGIGARS